MDRPVRVILKLHDGLSQAVEEAKARLVGLMLEAGAPTVEPIVGQPLIVMELFADHLDILVETGLVEALQEDQPGRAL